jgi:hypothetical protein
MEDRWSALALAGGPTLAAGLAGGIVMDRAGRHSPAMF